MTEDELAAVLTRATGPANEPGAGPGGRASSDGDLNADSGDWRAPGQTRPAAVLVAFVRKGGAWRLILTRRAAGLLHHPGQIAFPGGKIDADDTDARAAALREAREEIGLPPAQVRVLGMLPPHVTISSYEVFPVVGIVAGAFDPVADPREVDEVFTVPLDHIADIGNYRIEQRPWRGQMRKYYVLPHGPYYIFGATARILRALAERMGP